MRGYIHQVAFFIALVATLVLCLHSHTTRALTANLIYSVSLISLYGISALYHCSSWGYHTNSIMRRIDHTAIFILIAGSTTPICLLGLNNTAGTELLTQTWTITLMGILVILFKPNASKWIRITFYIATGWLALIYLPEINHALGINNMILLIAGGLIYTLGACVYAFKYPNPYPRVFGYHEIFHTLIVIASAFHFWIIYHLVSV